MKICIIGTGLIGGSYALDIRRHMPEAERLGVDENSRHLEEAIRLGLVDRAAEPGELAKADMVLVCIPVDKLIHELPAILDQVGPQGIVIDAGSTKAPICEALKDHPKRRNFLASHPIAGTEYSGPAAAVEGLYMEKTNIICEVEQTAFKLQERAMDFFRSLGMRIRYMDPESHDRHIAYVSHLSHISSFMLGKTVIEKEKDDRDIFDMAGSGFASTVRLAKSSPAMWTPIFRQNKTHVTHILDAYIENLRAFRELLEQDDFEGIYNEMDRTNRIREILEGMPVPQQKDI